MTEQEDNELNSIAVIGMAGRFPGAVNLEEFWRNLCDGQESTRFFEASELDPSLNPEEVGSPDYVRARGIINDADAFDAAFFGISAREAELMDPQNRVFLQTAWEALERAGYCPEGFDGLIGVYAGMANNSYYPSSVMPRPDLIKRIGEFQTMLANEKDFLSTRVSHKLNLTGPSVSMYTGCSTSLVAICHAFNSLLSYQCDMALAGGVSINCPQHSGYLYREDGIESIDGHCRPFDAAATGTVFSDGVGIVVLKRLEDALADRDHIHAIIRGAALNNDGADKVSFAAPSVQGQADVIAMAHAQADVDPASIGLVETHGTATQLGDPIEFEGLKRAFLYPRSGSQYCALGSVKSNFGHALAAAGVAGFIKAVMALENRQIPPMLHFRQANPAIDLDNSPFYINTDCRDWPTGDQPRRAGVSSFGIGGTNAHVVLEQAPAQEARVDEKLPQLILLSARQENALNQAAKSLESAVSQQQAALADVAFTLQTGRRVFPHRLSVVASSAEELSERIQSRNPSSCISGSCQTEDPDIVFVFPGLGSQYAGMGRSLYQQAPVFRETIDRCAECIAELSSFDLCELLYGEPASALNSPTLAQITLFATEYALAQWLMALGISPKSLIGYSIGEWVAACVSKVISLEDALRALLGRGAIFEEAAEGLMLSVRLPADELAALCGDQVHLAAVNAPKLSVVSGTADAVEALEKTLAAEGIPHRRLAANRPFHSPIMAPTIAGSLDATSLVEYARPRVPIISTVTGSWVNPQSITDPAYWSRHHCEPVQFKTAIETAANNKQRLFLEVGPGCSLSTCIAQTLGNTASVAPFLPDEWTDLDSERSSVLMGLARLWHEGVSPRWGEAGAGTERRTALPGYPFAENRYWLDAVARSEWLVPKG